MRAIEPFRAGDTVTFGPEVTTKKVEEGRKIVECRVRGINQRGDLASLSDAKLVVPEQGQPRGLVSQFKSIFQVIQALSKGD